MLAMLGEVADKAVLDLGCGEGGYARELARRGARVTGVDGSARLIEVARQRARAEGVDVRFVHANANALPEAASDRFDVVVAPMSLMDVEDYRGSIREVQRVLRRGGELVMSITHPCFSAPLSEWIRDADGSLRVFAVDRYFERIAWPQKITAAFHSQVLRRHRPLEDYMAAPLECGLRLGEFHEPSVKAHADPILSIHAVGQGMKGRNRAREPSGHRMLMPFAIRSASAFVKSPLISADLPVAAGTAMKPSRPAKYWSANCLGKFGGIVA